MNALDNIERTLEEWGQNLRGGTAPHGLQPRDVLRAVLESLEHNRVEGLDHRVYAPNAYTVQLYLDEEERSRLLPFVGREELEAAVQRYCDSHKYQFRGPLAIQVAESSWDAAPTAPADDVLPRDGNIIVEEAATKTIIQSRFDVIPNWDSDLARQFVLPPDSGATRSDHDIQRRDIPTYAGSSRRN